MKKILSVMFLLTVVAVVRAESDSKGFTPLWDGKTLQGWEGNPKSFRIEKGAIIAGSLKERIPRNEFLCTTKRYEDFELRLKAKLVGKDHNAGIQFRSERIPNHHEVKGYQCDMGLMADRLIWGSLYDESRRRRMLAQGDKDKLKKVVTEGDWNQFVIRCQGARIQIWVNGLQTIDYTETEKDIPRTGIIGLQIHSGKPTEAWYKDIKIKAL